VSVLYYLHLAGALALAGGLFAAVVLAVGASRRTRVGEVLLLAHAAHRSLLFLVWPGFVVLTAAGAWLAEKDGVSGSGWVGAGYWLALVLALGGGGVLLLHNARVVRQARDLAHEGVDDSEELARLASGLLPRLLGPALLLVLALAVGIMVGKP
jgi:hypothetical protein